MSEVPMSPVDQRTPPTRRRVVLRRSWPQRIVMVLCLAVIASAVAAAWVIGDIQDAVSGFGRVEISGEILITDTEPGDPVNFLLIGNDSALGIDPDDPIHIGRTYDARGTFNADSITLLRVDPTSGQAWMLPIPRDLITDHIPGAGTYRINAALLIGGPETLVETVSAHFGVEINHYVEIDFLGFRELVDVLNGVPVWFDRPARDLNSGLNIVEGGCHVLDGATALAYARSRSYQEFVDGRWVTVGNSDFGRIERQQDFLVLALSRAVNRGARNPTALAGLIEAGAGSVVLDSELTPAELIDLGMAFSDFNPENLTRLELRVHTVHDEGGLYVGEELVPDINEQLFDVFRGASGLSQPSEVVFDLYAADEVLLNEDGDLLAGLGFNVATRLLYVSEQGASVVLYPPGQRSRAEAVARYLIPVPALVEDAASVGIRVVLGTDHEQISFLFPHDLQETRTEAAAHTNVTVPDLSAAVLSSAAAEPDATPTAPAATAPAATAPAATAAASADDGISSDRVIGRPPEGQSCP
ncbi:MAG: LCP family protein [Acidimicrobiia bacterium]|nr:LCP family protein [Acidimicrobiia bacterium]